MQIDLIRLDGEFVLLGYRNQDAIKRLVRKSKNQVRVADSNSAYLPLSNPAATGAALAGVLKALLQQK